MEAHGNTDGSFVKIVICQHDMVPYGLSQNISSTVTCTKNEKGISSVIIWATNSEFSSFDNPIVLFQMS